MHTRSMNKKSTLALEMVTSNSFGKELVLDFFGDSVRHDEERKEKRERERERERKKRRAFQEQLASFIRVRIGRNVVRPMSRVRTFHTMMSMIYKQISLLNS